MTTITGIVFRQAKGAGILGERNCALQSAAYLKLKKAFDDRPCALRTLLQKGKKGIGIIGDDVPEEVLVAAGLFPIRVSGFYGNRPNADEYLEMSFGALWRGLFESVMNGSYADLFDRLVFSNSSDMIQKLYHYLNVIRTNEPWRNLPQMEMVDYTLMVKDYRSQERNVSVTEKFIARVEEWTGSKITGEDLQNAIRLCNAHKQALRDFSALRYGKESRVLGSEAMTVIVGSFFFEKNQAIELIRAVTEDARDWQMCALKPVFYTGSMQETTEVYDLMESSGLNIVSEDKIFGDRYSDVDTDASIAPARAISARYQLRFPSSERGFIAERARTIPERVAEVGAEGMVLFMNHNDESYIWDLPKQKIRLDEMGIPILSIEQQYWPLVDKTELRKRFAEFAKGGC